MQHLAKLNVLRAFISSALASPGEKALSLNWASANTKNVKHYMIQNI